MENAEKVIEALNGTKNAMEYFKLPEIYLSAYDAAIVAVKKEETIPEEIVDGRSYCPCCGAPLTPIRKMRVLIGNDEIYCYRCGQKVKVQGDDVDE